MGKDVWGGIRTGTVWLTAFSDQAREKTSYCVLAENTIVPQFLKAMETLTTNPSSLPKLLLLPRTQLLNVSISSVNLNC